MEVKTRPGRKRKNINFKPSKEFLKEAKKDFFKNGGLITKIENTIYEWNPAYQSESAMSLSELPDTLL